MSPCKAAAATSASGTTAVGNATKRCCRRARKRMVLEYTGLTPGFIRRAPVASFKANASYEYSYVFSYIFDVPADAKTLTLPDNYKIHISKFVASEQEPSV